MIAKKIELVETISTIENDEEYSIPLDISEIIDLCKEYSKLGNNIQMYMDIIFEFGVEQAIKSGKINKQYIPYIKNFLKVIADNQYLGDAANQSKDVLKLIDIYDNKNKVVNLFIN